MVDEVPEESPKTAQLARLWPLLRLGWPKLHAMGDVGRFHQTTLSGDSVERVPKSGWVPMQT